MDFGEREESWRGIWGEVVPSLGADACPPWKEFGEVEGGCLYTIFFTGVTPLQAVAALKAYTFLFNSRGRLQMVLPVFVVLWRTFGGKGRGSVAGDDFLYFF